MSHGTSNTSTGRQRRKWITVGTQSAFLVSALTASAQTQGELGNLLAVGYQAKVKNFDMHHCSTEPLKAEVSQGDSYIWYDWWVFVPVEGDFVPAFQKITANQEAHRKSFFGCSLTVDLSILLSVFCLSHSAAFKVLPSEKMEENCKCKLLDGDVGSPCEKKQEETLSVVCADAWAHTFTCWTVSYYLWVCLFLPIRGLCLHALVCGASPMSWSEYYCCCLHYPPFPSLPLTARGCSQGRTTSTFVGFYCCGEEAIAIERAL